MSCIAHVAVFKCLYIYAHPYNLMSKSQFFFYTSMLITGSLLAGCASKPAISPEPIAKIKTAEQRSHWLLANKKWRIRGKIAFIQKIPKVNKTKRESAAIAWQVDQNKHTQELNLTTFLGINVLRLTSDQHQHLIKVEGKEYRSSNLPQLIYSLTGLTLPTEALSFWLKGLPYQASDTLRVDKNTQLPIGISSTYHNALWQIDFSHYKTFNNINMATKFTIKKDDLLIKLAVKKWTFDN